MGRIEEEQKWFDHTVHIGLLAPFLCPRLSLRKDSSHAYNSFG